VNQPLDVARWQRIKALLADALEQPAGERLAFVARQSGGDPDLHAELRRALAVDGREIEPGRNDRKMLEGPAPPLGIEFLRRRQLQQMTDGVREHVAVALVIILLPGETAERTRDVGGNRRLFRNDQFFSHERAECGEETPRCAKPALRERKERTMIRTKLL